METESSSGQFTVETVSYFVSEGPGSLLKSGGGYSLDRSLFIDRQLDNGDPALSSSSSTQTLILWTSVSLRGKPITLTVRLESKIQEKQVCS